jgi:hypothetical protein
VSGGALSCSFFPCPKRRSYSIGFSVRWGACMENAVLKVVGCHVYKFESKLQARTAVNRVNCRRNRRFSCEPSLLIFWSPTTD